MIVSGVKTANIVRTYTENIKTPKTISNPKSRSGASGTDEVILSSQAQDFGALLQSLKDMPEVRNDMVEKISKQMESGSYRVDSGELAAKMIEKYQVF